MGVLEEQGIHFLFISLIPCLVICPCHVTVCALGIKPEPHHLFWASVIPSRFTYIYQQSSGDCSLV